MKRQRGACLVCGKSLIYFERPMQMKCSVCGGVFENNVSCEDGHYVCDECHSKKGIEAIYEGCRNSDSKNPVNLMLELMENPYIYMHGPEHHVLEGAAILTAYHNCGGELDLEEALQEMVRRGKEVPGGICGFWGCCGAAVSTGIAYSILQGATPVSGKSWSRCNRMTSLALSHIAEHGGPRCCKRNSFLAAETAVKVLAEETGIQLEMPDTLACTFSEENQQCLKGACPYYGGTELPVTGREKN